MSYIICAEVDTQSDENFGADPSLVDARILSRNGSCITFDVKGKFGEQKQRVQALCTTLINAGFFEFQITHSY